MKAGSAIRVYRTLLLLYPRDFRDRYTDDLVQTLTDLTGELGPRRAWRRVTLDLIVTVPRYRLETVMNEERSSTLLTMAITVIAVAGITSVFVGSVSRRGAGAARRLSWQSPNAASWLGRSTRWMAPDSGTSACAPHPCSPRRFRSSSSSACPYSGTNGEPTPSVAFGLWVGVLIAAVGYAIAGLSTPKSGAISP